MFRETAKHITLIFIWTGPVPQSEQTRRISGPTPPSSPAEPLSGGKVEPWVLPLPQILGQGYVKMTVFNAETPILVYTPSCLRILRFGLLSTRCNLARLRLANRMALQGRHRPEPCGWASGQHILWVTCREREIRICKRYSIPVSYLLVYFQSNSASHIM